MENTCVDSIFNKAAILKRDSNTGAFCDKILKICKISKKTYFEEHLRTTASRAS